MLRQAGVIIVILLGGLLGNALAPVSSRAQPPDATQNLSNGLPEGVTVTLLASTLIDALSSSDASGVALQLQLERIPLRPGTTHDGRDPEQGGEGTRVGFLGNLAANGAHLLYIESGEAVLKMNDGEEPLAHGEQMLVPEGTAYELRNNTGDCVSFLRLSAVIVGGGAGVAASEEVPYVPPACGEPDLLLRSTGTARSERRLLFLAQVTWEPMTPVTTHTHPGPVGLRLESGTLEVRDEGSERVGFYSHIDQGGWLHIRNGHPYAVRNDGMEPATALIVSAIPADEPFWVVSERTHTGRSYNYSLITPYRWTVIEDAWIREELGGHEWLGLEDTTNTVYFEAFSTSDGDPQRCLDDAIAGFQNDPHVDDIEPLPLPGSDPPGDNATGGPFARYTYTVRLENGPTSEEVGYFECRSLGAGDAVLKIAAFAPRADADAQLAALEELLNGLTLPE